MNFNTKELTSRELLNSKYEVTVKEKDIDFNWQITNETKNIGKFICYKATTKNFRGRNYEAWFTYEIPVPAGPWKFHGLPGLILEIHDDKDLINITFSSIQEHADKKVDYSLPNAKEVLTLEEYLNESFRLYISYVENQMAMIATGQMRQSNPLAYNNFEYTTEQIKWLNQYNEIEYGNYEKSIKEKKD
ncbi:GLPGLI family protein [Gelidibacter gilvus]|uniref:GLPGLI family protein n=1 Tax=Gelidibacter gilvus TaxID=59602 RepID=A0A4Q0XIW9_9FLAO|nr:GLPGLI family protein [Gelidibacter gilvus]